MAGKKIVIRTNFNNYTRTQECLTKPWIDYRISIFMNYTLNSLRAQTNQDFKAFVIYNPVTEAYIKQAIADHRPVPQNVEFIIEREYVKKINEYIGEAEELYIVNLESDDMYRRDFIELMHSYKLRNANTVMLICPYGYMFDSVQNRLVKFYFYAPSFCTFVYKVQDYKKGVNYPLKKGWISTLDYPHEIFKVPCYINHCHGKNSGLTFERATLWKPKQPIDAWSDHPEAIKAVFGPEIMDKAEMKSILDTFIGGRG